jgi:hypothetical protein
MHLNSIQALLRSRGVRPFASEAKVIATWLQAFVRKALALEAATGQR